MIQPNFVNSNRLDFTNENRRIVSIRMPNSQWTTVSIDRLYQLGMTKYPKCIDLSEIPLNASNILGQIFENPTKKIENVSLSEMAEILNIADVLTMRNLSKCLEANLISAFFNTSSTSSDSESRNVNIALFDFLAVAVYFRLLEAEKQILNRIIDEFNNESYEILLLHCKSSQLIDLITKKYEEKLKNDDDAADANAAANAMIDEPAAEGDYRQHALAEHQQSENVIFRMAKTKIRIFYDRQKNKFHDSIVPKVRNLFRRMPNPTDNILIRRRRRV